MNKGFLLFRLHCGFGLISGSFTKMFFDLYSCDGATLKSIR